MIKCTSPWGVRGLLLSVFSIVLHYEWIFPKGSLVALMTDTLQYHIEKSRLQYMSKLR